MLILMFAAAAGLAPQQTPPPQQTADSVYATEALRTFVAAAAARNATPPPSLQSYGARVETELSFVQSQPDGGELLLQLEQVASDFSWRADGAMRQDIIGYRSQTVGASFSGLSFFEIPFLVPTLYADRLDLVRTTSPSRSETGQLQRRRTLHPFAAGRDAVYTFSGGDTVDVIRLPDRTISLVRVHVTPRRNPALPTLLFDGDIDVDADRFHIVRMQGRLIPSGRPSTFLSSFIQGVLYVSLENAEYDEEYWLPREQRMEAQAVSRLGEGRVLFRTISRVIDLLPNDPDAAARAVRSDSFPQGRLVVGEMGRISSFGDWITPIGELSAGANAHDFDVYAPPGLRPEARSRITFGTRYFSQLARFNRVEGLYTGLGGTYHLTDRARLRAHAGYAWSEETARGGAEAEVEAGKWLLRARGERQLSHTSDFMSAMQPDPGITPLIAGDQYDFVDRRIASAIALLPGERGIGMRFEAGYADDRNVQQNVSGASDSLALTGRAAEGSFFLGRAQIHRNSTASVFSLQPGFGWVLRYEGASGELDWQRGEAGATLRRVFGPFTVSARVDGGMLFSDAPPPQALFDFANESTLPGYSGDEIFAGDRAALGRTVLMYSLPLLRSPIRIGGLYLPAIAPSPSVGFYAGWTDAKDETLGTLGQLGWQTTDGTRATMDLRMRFFGGSVSIGAARPIDRDGAWKFVWGWVSEL
ncbi:MAG TPA: hypothetical protein VF035_06955 [Longimicrobiales bacterium]